MTTRVSSRDWETLSAYLDGQLSRAERARLETRLKSSPDLQQALQELRRTRAVVRSLPKLRAPRNYTLSPKMAGIRQRQPRVYPIFRFASLLASLLFILVVAGDYLVAQRFTSAPLGAAQTEEAPMAMMEAAPEGTPSGPVGGGVVESPQEEPAETGARTTDQTTQAEVESMQASGLEAAPTGPVESPTIGPPSAESREGEPLPQVLSAEDAQEEQVRAPFGLRIGEWGIFRIAEIALALVAILTGLIAVLLRRGFQQ